MSTRQLTGILLAICTFASMLARAETVVHYTPLEDPSDKRLEWPIVVLKLALQKTAESYGSYRFEPIPQAVSQARSVLELNRDTYPNYFFPGGPNIAQMGGDHLIKLDYPLDHGLLSYRICFVSPASKDAVAAARTIDDLRQFTIGQGSGWLDVSILQANKFHVQQVPNYTSLFKMVMGNRIDLFCRGVGELRKEYAEYKSLGNLQYDTSFVFFYSTPYSLYFNKNSKPLVQRLEEGLKIARKDGSLQELFVQYHRDDIAFAKLKDRKIFKLYNPYDQPQSESFNSFLVDPTKIN